MLINMLKIVVFILNIILEILARVVREVVKSIGSTIEMVGFLIFPIALWPLGVVGLTAFLCVVSGEMGPSTISLLERNALVAGAFALFGYLMPGIGACLCDVFSNYVYTKFPRIPESVFEKKDGVEVIESEDIDSEGYCSF